MASPDDDGRSAEPAARANPGLNNGRAARFVELVGPTWALALAACLVGAIPAATRTFRAGGSPLGAVLVATAVLLPAVALGIAISRAAGRGYRLVTGNSAGAAQGATVALFVGLLAPMLLALGAILKDGTNHRGLGGATFGVVSAGCVVVSVLVAVRIVATGRWLVARGLPDRAVGALFAVVAVLPTALLGIFLLRAKDPSQVAPLVNAAVIDGLLLTVVSAAVLSVDLGDTVRSILRRFGVIAAASCFVIGVFWLTLSAPLSASMQKGGGLASTLLRRLERWTDRDGDGVGSHFGGQDCDDGDALRYPGAVDHPGDGLDQDCDGHDAGTKEEVLAKAELPVTPPPIKVAAPPSTKPHVVMVTLESLRADRTSLYGYNKETTKELQALAARGVVFEQAFASASDPQRAMMPFFSGVSYGETPKDRRQWPTLKDEAQTLAERVSAAGYETHGISCFQWLSRERGFAQGFSDFEEVFREEHPERGVTGPLALRSFRALVEKVTAQSKPQFIWVHLFDAHEEWRRHDGLDFGRGEGGAYDSEVAFVDRIVGDIDRAIEKSPLAGKTLLVVHGTYGESLGERSKTGSRQELTNEHVRVPLVVVGPGIEPARITERAVSVSSVTDLILNRTGAQASAEDPLVATSKPAPVLLQTHRRRGIVVYPWKLISVERKGKQRLLLFDLKEDPGEKKDRSESEPQMLRELSALLDVSLPRKVDRDARR